MKVSRQDWIKILCGIALGSFVLAFAQGWFAVQLQYFIILLMIVFGMFVFWHKKESKIIDIEKAYKTCLPELQRFGLASESGAKLLRFFKVSDNKRFSSYGKVWDLEFKGNPGRSVILVDARTGKIVGGDLHAVPRESPIQTGWKEPTYMVYPPRRMKRTIKEEVKPS